MKLILGLIPLAVLLSACGPTGSAVLTGTQRAAVTGNAVTVYVQPPTKPYEIVGIVTSRSVNGFTQQSDTQYATDELRRQAAKLGANGVVLNAVNAGSTANLMGGMIGTTNVALISGHNSQAQLQGTAIYVSH